MEEEGGKECCLECAGGPKEKGSLSSSRQLDVQPGGNRRPGLEVETSGLSTAHSG